jgi:phosphatidate cytidylyltransferase
LYEFYGMALASGAAPFVVPSMTAGALIYGLSYLVSASILPYRTLILVIPLFLFLFIIALYSHRPEVIRNTAVSLLGVIYVVFPVAATNFLAFPGANGNDYTHRIILGILVLVWLNDTGAYLVGITLGRHRLFERISPGKSWEGAIGAAIITLGASWWMHDLTGILSMEQWMVLALIASVFGVFGDLTESLFKRSVNIKDSGTLIPGHGGVLDRVDSILFVMPLALCYLAITGF